MNENINLIEILRDCKENTELYSPLFGTVRFKQIDTKYNNPFPVIVYTEHSQTSFGADGRYYANYVSSECMLFPSKDNRDWSTFKSPRWSNLPKTWEGFCQTHDVRPTEAFIDIDSQIMMEYDHEAYGAKAYHLNDINPRCYDTDRNLLPDKKTAEAMLALCQLIQLRDCYNDGWKPDWTDNEAKYFFYFYSNELRTTAGYHTQGLFSFKTKELCDSFLTNFRELIETAKPLL